MELNETQEITMKAAQVAYEAYANHTGWKSAVTGDYLPTWKELPASVCNAWFSSIEGVLEYLAALNHIRSLRE